MEHAWQALPDIALFVEVARTGSFRHAAARLGVPPATLSRRIAALEARLGLKLLQRTTRSVTLAPVAKPYYDRCLEVLEAAARAQATIDSSLELPSRIRISMPVDLGVEVLGPVVAAFIAASPGLQVELDLSSRAADLLRDPVDLVFRIGRTMDDRVVARRIADIASGVFAAPGLLERIGPIASAAQLTHAPCLNLQAAQGPMPWKVGHHRWDAAPGPSSLSANSVALLRTLAEQGYGLALLPAHIAATAVQSGRLVRVLPGEATPAWPLYAITASRMVPASVRQLMNHVRAALEASPIA